MVASAIAGAALRALLGLYAVATAAWLLAASSPAADALLRDARRLGGVDWLVSSHPLLSRVPAGADSYTAALILLAALGIAALIDATLALRRVVWGDSGSGEDLRIFRAALTAAGAAMAVFGALAVSRGALGEGSIAVRAATAGTVIATYLAAFATVFLALHLLRLLARATSAPARIEFLSLAILAAAAIGLASREIVLPPLALGEPRTLLAAAAIGLSLALFTAAVSLRVAARRPPVWVDSGVEALLAGFVPSARSSVVLRCVWAALVAVTAVLALRATEYVPAAQEALAVVSLCALFAAAYRLRAAPAGRRDLRWIMVGAATLPAVGYAALHQLVPMVVPRAELSRALDEYARRDPAYQLLRRWSAPPAEDEQTFYAFAHDSMRPRAPRAASIEFSAAVVAAEPPRPNIFVIDVRGLRPDYLRPYRSDVTFTPAIADFAAGAVVFTNAFTRHTGSRLAGPSLWAGSMLPPAARLPTPGLDPLARLLTANEYHTLLAPDRAVGELLDASARNAPLRAAAPAGTNDLCGVLKELEPRLPAGAQERPVFALVIATDLELPHRRDGYRPLDADSYGEHLAAYASRVKRIDACFGGFVNHLERTGLLDSSIVVLTASHGAALGEHGRWGTGEFVTPEVVRVPLIVRLPAGLSTRITDTASLAFVTDVVPTLYELLGNRPERRQPFFGVSLLGERRRTTSAVVSAADAPVFGLLEAGGERLLVSDAVSHADEAYRLAGNGRYERDDARSGRRRAAHAEIRRALEALDAFFFREGGTVSETNR